MSRIKKGTAGTQRFLVVDISKQDPTSALKGGLR